MKIFWSFTRQAFHTSTIYRVEFWLRFVGVYLWMYAIAWVWRVLYTQSPGAFGVSLEQMVTYGVLGSTLGTFLEVSPEWYMATQVRTGAIDTDLMKPLDFHVHMLARGTGELLFGFGIMALPTFIVGHIFFGLQFPHDAAAGLLFALSVVLAFFVVFHLGFLLGSIVMLTLDIRSISWAYYSVIWFFAGQTVPLWLFPKYLRAVAEVLPFKSIYYIPSSIYIGTFTGESALRSIGFQVVWAIVLALISRWAWKRVDRRLTVQGG